jgi:hypothetical protein
MARGAHTDYEQLPSGSAPDVIMNKVVGPHQMSS